MSDALTQLKTLLDDGCYLADADSLQYYGRDWTKLYTPAPSAVVFPKSIEQVQAIVKWANEHKIGLVPSGGRTGLSGGACACNQEVVVSFEKMAAIKDFNPIDNTIVCEAGVVTERLKHAAEEYDRFFPVDFASKGSSQIGGNIATNAGGVNVLRYGPTRNWVAGLKVVTGMGEILNLNYDLVKNNTGYDLRQLWIGSEGTLGFVVEATLWLSPKPKASSVMVLAVEDMASIMPIFERFTKSLTLNAFEFFSDIAIGPMLKEGRVTRPFETIADYYVLIDFENAHEQDEAEALSAFEECAENGWLLDGVISQNESQKQSLWQLREGISESLAPLTPYKNDLAVHTSKMPKFSEQLLAMVNKEYPDFTVVLFGHIGDGNIHLNILKPKEMTETEFFAKCHEADAHIFALIQQFGGSVSAEHGVGLLKKDFLSVCKSEAEIGLMKGIKKVFDPNGIMNPGKVFEV